MSRVQVKNFRNFHHVDVRLGPTSVVVGENSVGKPNLLFALRLVLDPRLSDASRQIRGEDFWEGLREPVKNKETIEVTVEFQDFQKDKNVFTVLQPYCVHGSVPDTARLTYRFRPKSPSFQGPRANYRRLRIHRLWRRGRKEPGRLLATSKSGTKREPRDQGLF